MRGSIVRCADCGSIVGWQTGYGTRCLNDNCKTNKHGDDENMKILNDIAQAVHNNAKDHGWHDEKRSLGETCALIHSEVSEALEEGRKGKKPTETYYREDRKPEGIPSEMADVIIRVLDYCAAEGIDIAAAVEEKHHFNVGRPYKHGKVF